MSKQLIFEVEGTSCASCEIVIEREVIQMKGVKKVIASHTSNRLTIFTDAQTKIHEKHLERRFPDASYTFKRLSSEQMEKEIQQAPPVWNLKRIGGMVIIILATYKILQVTGVLMFSPEVEQSSGLFAVFGIGLVAAVSSCTAVVGGLVAAVSTAAAKKHPERTFAQKLHPHILFNTGRLVGFVFFGALIGWAGQVLSLSPTLNGLFVLIIAVMMIAIGINLLELLPKNLSVIRPPKWLSHRIHELSNSSHPSVPFVLGAATFFLPCGFTQSMQLFVLSLGDPWQAGILMGVFALGTIPALFGIGALTSVAKGGVVKKVTRIAGVIVIVLGISNMQNSMALLGWGLPDVFAQEISVESWQPHLVNGKQLIQMEISSRGSYEPSALTVVEDIPVQWEIFGPEFMGCANTLILREFGVSTYLQSGMNTVTFTPTKTGRFVFSCSMGMIRGTMNVISQESK